MYLYKGRLIEMMAAAGASIIAGFWTRHGDPDDFRLGDWEGLFHGTITTGGIGVFSVSYAEFNNNSLSTITGSGLGIGGGAGWAFAEFWADYWRTEDWMIPLWLLAVAYNKVFFGSLDGLFYCLNTENGELVWKMDPSYYEKFVIGGSLFSVSTAKSLAAPTLAGIAVGILGIDLVAVRITLILNDAHKIHLGGPWFE